MPVRHQAIAWTNIDLLSIGPSVCSMAATILSRPQIYVPSIYTLTEFSLYFPLPPHSCVIACCAACSSSSSIPKESSTLCWRAVRKRRRSEAYCCSISSCVRCSSNCLRCSWSARVLRMSNNNSCRNRRFSALMRWVWSPRQEMASWIKGKQSNETFW